MRKIYVILVLFAFATIKTNAAIVYTDIADGTPVGLDFNNDGTDEFGISEGSGTGDYITYWDAGQENNNVYAVGDADAGWDEAASLVLGTSIDAGGNWAGYGDCTVTGWGGATDFPFNADAYIGLKMLIDGNTHYGWVRVSVSGSTANPTVIYKDMAYNDTPDAAIEVGDMGSGTALSEMQIINLSVYPNPSSDFLFIESELSNDATELVIYSVEGKQVYSSVIENAQEKINISHLSNGVYLLSLNSKEKISNIRIVKN